MLQSQTLSTRSSAPLPNCWFGKTGLEVSRLGLGAAELGFENLAPRAVDALLGTALDAGLNVIDTAECYQDSEQKLGRALQGRRRQCLLFTKCGHAFSSLPAARWTLLGRSLRRRIPGAIGRAYADWDPRLIERSIERSLRRLRTDWIDLIQLHSCSEETLREGAVMDALQRARQAGKVRYIGYSGDGAAALYAVQSGSFDSLQTSFNVADQQAADLTLPLASQRGMGIIAKRPIANAVWRYTSRPENSYLHVYWDRLQELGYDFLRDGSNALEIALRFTLSAANVHTAIVGTVKPQHWTENAASVSAGELDPDLMHAIRTRWKSIARPDWVAQQ